jgi:hypothetical protein
LISKALRYYYRHRLALQIHRQLVRLAFPDDFAKERASDAARTRRAYAANQLACLMYAQLQTLAFPKESRERYKAFRDRLSPEKREARRTATRTWFKDNPERVARYKAAAAISAQFKVCRASIPADVLDVKTSVMLLNRELRKAVR